MEELNRNVSTASDLPWIVFRLGKNQCAISSERISSITLLTDNITAMPNTPPYVRGLLSLRGSAIPLLDLRSVFGQVTLLDEYNEFAEMLEHRKQDHLHWAQELRNSIENHQKFTLTTDPHKCAFGQWYDNYHDERSTVRFQLAKIDEPHKKLHHAAVLAQDALSTLSQTEQEEALKQIITEVETQDIPAIVGLLDETAAVIKDNIREQVLVLGTEDHQVGCIVDEVLAVQELAPISSKEAFKKIIDTQYVIGVSQNDQGLVLLLDDNIFEQSLTTLSN